MSVITVVGSGQMGSALSFPARDNGHEVRLVGTPLDRPVIDRARVDSYHINLKRTLPDGIKYYYYEQLDEALRGTDVLISGVSSFGVDWFLENVLPRIPSDMPILSVTKGLIDLGDGNVISYPEYYRRHFPGRSFCLNAVGGPCTSYELADRDPSYVCFCGEDKKVLEFLRDTMRTAYYHISISNDVMGVESAVALKNVYALGVTLAVGMAEKRDGKIGSLHYNSQAALFAQSVREMRHLLREFGCRDENIVFGAGDLYVTVFGGRTRMIGTLLGRGIPYKEAIAQLKGVTLESLVIAGRASNAVRERIKTGRLLEKDFPLLLHCDDVIRNGKDASLVPWDAFETDEFI